MNNYFRLKLPFGDFIYRVDASVKESINRTIQYLVDNKYEVKSFVFDDQDARDIVEIFEALIENNCTYGYVRSSLTGYFSDRERFGADSPYSTFDDLFKSELLNRHWKEFFRKCAQYSSPVCDEFISVRQIAVNMVQKWFVSNQIDLILMPTVSNLDYENDRRGNPFNTFVPIFTLAGTAALSVPVGQSPTGLPVGMLVQTRGGTNQMQSLLDAFEVGRLFEDRVDMPRSTPQIPLLRQIINLKAYSDNKLKNNVQSKFNFDLNYFFYFSCTIYLIFIK